MNKFKKATLLAVILSAGLVGCVKKEPCNTLPEGWTIVTDGIEYKFKRENGGLSAFNKTTKEKAIEWACEQKRYEDRTEDKGQWVEVAN